MYNYILYDIIYIYPTIIPLFIRIIVGQYPCISPSSDGANLPLSSARSVMWNDTMWMVGIPFCMMERVSSTSTWT